MKKLFLLASLLAATMPALGQGYVNFASAAVGVNAQTTNGFTNQRVSGNSHVAMLYIGPPGTREYSALTTNGVAGAPAFFSTGALAGYFVGGTRAISGYNPGNTITAQVRVWNSFFSNYEAAPNAERTTSTLINLKLGTAGGPSNLVGLTHMRITLGGGQPLFSLSNQTVGVGGMVTLAPNCYWCVDPPLDFTWSFNSTNISYAPSLTITNAQLSDAGLYGLRVEDTGGWTFQTATLLVTQAVVRLNSPRLTNGHLEFTLTGSIGSNYVIQFSSDLTTSNWVSRLTNTAPFTFVDTNLGVGPQQFYRAITP